MLTSTENGDKYAYRAYLELELNYSRNAKSTHVTAAGYTFENEDVLDKEKQRIANGSVGGWKTALEYEHDELAEDDEDEYRI
uniref:Uncharacterized protein n=1 Tax=Romanomermis culicivorax TaxID=13658 RepID=A0A915KXE4_ROMCU